MHLLDRVTVMKQSQIVVSIVLLAAMVFGITFALNYIGNSGTTGSGTSIGDPPALNNLALTFGENFYPPEGIPYKEQEYGQSGYQDFWFVNPHDKPVAIGLEGTSCTCAEVHVYMVGPDWTARRSALLAGQLAGQAAGVLSALPLAMALEEDPELKSLAKAAPVLPLTKTDTITVPPHKVGWVRLGWTAIQPGQTPVKNLGASVWMGQKGSGKAVLQVNVHYGKAFEIASKDRDQWLGELSPSALPVHRTFLCWSVTRSTMDLKAQMISLRGRPDLDPFVVGAPQALSVQECRSLEEEFRKVAVQTNQALEAYHVLCAYRIPVTLRGSPESLAQERWTLGPFGARS